MDKIRCGRCRSLPHGRGRPRFPPITKREQRLAQSLHSLLEIESLGSIPRRLRTPSFIAPPIPLCSGGGSRQQRRGGSVSIKPRRMALLVVREGLFVALSFAGAWLFLNHDLLYFLPSVRPAAAPRYAYAVVTAIIYLFMRGVSMVAGLRLPQKAEGRAPKMSGYPGVKPVRRIIPAPMDRETSGSPADDLRAAIAAVEWMPRSESAREAPSRLILVGPLSGTRTVAEGRRLPPQGVGRPPR